MVKQGKDEIRRNAFARNDSYPFRFERAFNRSPLFENFYVIIIVFLGCKKQVGDGSAGCAPSISCLTAEGWVWQGVIHLNRP